jgi:hypothetical protein
LPARQGHLPVARRRLLGAANGTLVRFRRRPSGDVPIPGACGLRACAGDLPAGHLGLQPKQAKTRIARLTEGGEGVDFLGFHHRLVLSGSVHRVTLPRRPARALTSRRRERTCLPVWRNGSCELGRRLLESRCEVASHPQPGSFSRCHGQQTDASDGRDLCFETATENRKVGASTPHLATTPTAGQTHPELRFRVSQ